MMSIYEYLYRPFYLTMEPFKNPFQEDEGDQMISIAENSPALPPEPQPQSLHSLAGKQEPQKESRNEKVSIQNHYDGEQTIFMTRPDALSSKGSIIYEEPPLLEDVGVDPELIADKIISIIKLETPTQRYIEESDLFGPSMIAFLLGLLLMLSGKMHFGDIYALFVLGNILIFVLFNLMSSNEIISLYAIMSTLGYCLFPMLLVGLVGIFMKLQNSLGILLSLGLSGWCAYSASAYIEILIKANENDRKMLIGYPLYLYYASFAMITIF